MNSLPRRQPAMRTTPVLFNGLERQCPQCDRPGLALHWAPVSSAAPDFELRCPECGSIIRPDRFFVPGR